MPDTVGFAVWGAGGIARAWARGGQNAPSSRLVGAYDVAPAVAEDFAAQHGGRAYATPEAMLDDPAVEAVVVCTPNAFHCPNTLAAAAAGKHVLTEKPMGLSVGECDQMIAACREAGVQLMVGQALRFYQPFADVLDLARGGEMGRVLGADLVRIGGPAPPGQERVLTWRDDDAMTGGWLFELHVHEVDYLLALMGEPIAVTAHRSNLLQPPSPVDHDLLNVTMTFPGGSQGHLLGGKVAWGGALDYLVMGEKLCVRWQDWAPRVKAAGPEQATPEEREFPARPEAMAAQLEGFGRAVLEEAPVPVTGEEGRRVIAVMERIRAAWAETAGA